MPQVTLKYPDFERMVRSAGPQGAGILEAMDPETLGKILEHADNLFELEWFVDLMVNGNFELRGDKLLMEYEINEGQTRDEVRNLIIETFHRQADAAAQRVEEVCRRYIAGWRPTDSELISALA